MISVLLQVLAVLGLTGSTYQPATAGLAIALAVTALAAVALVASATMPVGDRGEERPGLGDADRILPVPAQSHPDAEGHARPRAPGLRPSAA